MTTTNASRPPHNGQLSDLPGNSVLITGHDDSTGKAIVHSTRDVPFQPYDNDQMSMGVVYTTNFPANLDKDSDINAHDNLLSGNKLGLVHPGGTVCRTVDFGPGYTCMMHRTQSLDYGIVVEGEIEMLLDSGETKKMGRGDVAVQRATMHAWKNVTPNDGWARMIFVLQDCQKPEIMGQKLGEDLGVGVEGLPASGHDQ